MTYLHDPFNKPSGPNREFTQASVKQQQADELAADIAAFKKQGGKIQILANGEGARSVLGKTRQQMTRAERARESKKRQKDSRMRLSNNAPQFDDEEE